MNTRIKCKPVFNYLLLFLTMTIVSQEKLLADVVWTKNGMIINGKVIKNKRRSVVLKNYSGTFNIPRKIINKLYITGSPEEDQTILRRLGKKVDRKIVERNYYSGVGKKPLPKKKKRKKIKKVEKKYSKNKIIYISPLYLQNYGGIGELLPTGYGGSLTFKYKPKANSSVSSKNLIPDLRFEAQYLYFKKDVNMIDGGAFIAGLGWSYNFSSYMGVHMDFLGGIGAFRIENDIVKNKENKLLGNVIFGFDFYIYSMVLVPEVRYHFIQDNLAELKGTSFNFGMGFQF